MFLGRLRVYPESAVPAGPGASVVTLIADFPYKRQVATVIVDVVLITVAYYSAYILRFEAQFKAEEPLLIQSLPIIIACQMAVFALFRVYQRVWRYTSVSDLITLAKAVSGGVVASVLVLLFAYRFEGYSRTVFLLDWLFTIAVVCSARIGFRFYHEEIRPSRIGSVVRLLIVGAGAAGSRTSS